MKKLVLGGFVLTALAAAGWTAFWFMGRGTIEAAVDAEIARLDDRGWTVSYGTRSVSGFPFGYHLRLGDVGLVRRENGGLVRLPEVEADWAPGESELIRLRAPGDIAIDLPVNQTMLLRDPSLPPVLKVAVQSEGLELLVGPQASGAILKGEAALVRLKLEQDDYHGRMDLWAKQADFGVRPDGEGGRFDLVAGRLINELNAAEPGAAPVAMRTDLSGVTLAMEVSSMDGEVLGALLSGGGPGHALLDYAVEGMTSDLDVDESEFGGWQGRFSVTSGAASGQLAARKGETTLDAQSVNTVWSVTPADEASPMRGSVEIGAARYAHRLPLLSDETASPARIDLTIDDVVPDAHVWSAIDAGNALDRAPMALAAALDLRLKATPDGQRSAGAGGLGYEVSGVGIEALSINALGASIEAAGDVDILQPIAIPLGQLSVKARGLVGLIGDLEKAGLIGADQRQMGDAILQVYARPGDGPDSWETDMTFATEGIKVNGVPLQ